MQFGVCPVQGGCGPAHPPAISALIVTWTSGMLDGINCAVTPIRNVSAKPSVSRRFAIAAIARHMGCSRKPVNPTEEGLQNHGLCLYRALHGMAGPEYCSPPVLFIYGMR